jgi:hypothetical protein
MARQRRSHPYMTVKIIRRLNPLNPWRNQLNGYKNKLKHRMKTPLRRVDKRPAICNTLIIHVECCMGGLKNDVSHFDLLCGLATGERITLTIHLRA